MIFKHLLVITLITLSLTINQQIQEAALSKVVGSTKTGPKKKRYIFSEDLQGQNVRTDFSADTKQHSFKQEVSQLGASQLQIQILDNAHSNLKLERFLQQVQISTVSQKLNSQSPTSTIETPNSTGVIPLNSPTFALELKPAKQITNKTTDKIISTQQSFSNIILHHKIPSNFLLGQIFTFKGHIVSPNSGSTMVNVIFKRIVDSYQMEFSSTLKSNQTVFNIPTYLKEPGQYNLAIFTGLSGRGAQPVYIITKYTPPFYTVLPPLMVKEAHLLLKGNDLFVEWSSSQEPVPCISKIVFWQGTNKVSYIVSNFQTTLKVPYADFYDFREGIVNVQVSQAYSDSQSAHGATSAFSIVFSFTFNATRHNFAKMDSTNSLNAIPMKVSVGSSFLLSGKASVALSNQVYLQTPSKKFQIFNITSSGRAGVVPPQTFFNITVDITQGGVYILQINNADGSAIYNAPIYSGDIYPLVPDFVDLSPKQNDLTALAYPTSIKDRQSLVLGLINKVRAQFNASNVYLDDALSAFAQNYSQNQATYNYIGHVDLQGRTLKQRLANANITAGVSQNLALDMNLTEAELMLQRSPAHLRNTVNPAWTRVGLGIAQNAKGYYYLTQEFSSRDMDRFPLTNSQTATIKRQIITKILDKYPTVKGENTALSNILSNYQLDSDLIAYLKAQSIAGSLLAFKMVVSYDGVSYLDLVRGQLKFTLSSNLTRLGLTVVYREGLLNIVGAFSS